MTPELTLLVWACALTLLQVVVTAIGGVMQVGLPTLAGNRQDLGPFKGWAGRSQRAHRNMLENLVLFAALVLTAHAAGVSSEMTVLGAQLFFWARLAYAIIYIIGVPWLRTGAWVVSIAGLALIFVELI